MLSMDYNRSVVLKNLLKELFAKIGFDIFIFFSSKQLILGPEKFKRVCYMTPNLKIPISKDKGY